MGKAVTATLVDEATIDIYVQDRGKRPRKVGNIARASKIPSTYEDKGKVYIFASGDYVNGWLTYTDIKSA